MASIAMDLLATVRERRFYLYGLVWGSFEPPLQMGRPLAKIHHSVVYFETTNARRPNL
jgi:hypothetical protein